MTDDTPEVRYVVLRHTGHGPTHFDLMIEASPGGELMSWRLSAWPPRVGDAPQPLPPHRRAYLEYEGPISGDRGVVRRVDSGLCRHLSRGLGSRQVRFDRHPPMELPDA